VVTEILTIRSGPGFRYNKVGELLKGAEFDIMARWCGYGGDDDWYLIGIHGTEQRWILGARQYVSTWNTENLVCLVPPPTPTTTPVNPNFRADRTNVAPGECTILRWDVAGVYAVYLNGESVMRHSTKRVCPPQTRTYVITVIEPDGRRRHHELTLHVGGPQEPSGAISSATAQAAGSGPSETATFGPTVTATPVFPQVVTDQAHLLEFKLAIGRYRLAEKAALKSPDSAAVEQLPDFAYGEALAAVLGGVEQLRVKGVYQELTVQQMDVQTAILQNDQLAGVLLREKHTLRTYRPSPDGSLLIEEDMFEGPIVYGLTYIGSQWKVERVQPVSNMK
jgi:hypothetical protein